jgi:hypothetical protein
MRRSTDPEDTDAELDRRLDRTAQLYEGRIVRVGGRGRGVVKSARGDEISFDPTTVDVRGTVRRVRSLRNGMRITFDVALTADGPQVTTIWVGTPEGLRNL